MPVKLRHKQPNKFSTNNRIKSSQITEKLLNGLAESTTANDMLKFVLDSCGISVEEFKNMPNTEQEAQEMTNNIKESFIRTFNKLLITY